MILMNKEFNPTKPLKICNSFFEQINNQQHRDIYVVYGKSATTQIKVILVIDNMIGHEVIASAHDYDNEWDAMDQHIFCQELEKHIRED